MKIKKITLLTLVTLFCIQTQTANSIQLEEAGPGQTGLYGIALSRTSDREMIKNHLASLQTMGQENNPKKNATYQRQIKSAVSYAHRYINQKCTAEQTAARKAFIAQFKIPRYLDEKRQPLESFSSFL